MAFGSQAFAQCQMHEMLDSCPVRSRHYALWTLAAGGTLLDGMSLAALAIALPLIKQTYSMSPLMIGAVSAGSVVGMGILVVAVGSSGDAKSANMVLVVGGFCVFNLMMNMGPNSTTFGLPALLFPSEIRATAAGFSAACAKTGATMGTLFLPMLGKSIGLGYTLSLLAGLSGLGFLVTVVLGKGLLDNRAASKNDAKESTEPPPSTPG